MGTSDVPPFLVDTISEKLLSSEKGAFDNKKTTGIVCEVGELGRTVIPIELRRTLGIGEKDALEIYVDGERIILKKYEPACSFSGIAKGLVHYKGKMISQAAIKELAELINEKASK
jgi:transcriptional pleiotropic regulator of transition state genes